MSSERRTHHHPHTGERTTVLAATDDHLLLERELPPHLPPAPRHVHPRQRELVEVVSGRVRFAVGTDVIDAGPGDVVVVPAGVPHRVRCSGDVPAVVRVEVRPPLRTAEHLRALPYDRPRPSSTSPWSMA